MHCLRAWGVILVGFGKDSIWSSGVAQSGVAEFIPNSIIADFQMVIQVSSPFHSSIDIILKIAITPDITPLTYR